MLKKVNRGGAKTVTDVCGALCFQHSNLNSETTLYYSEIETTQVPLLNVKMVEEKCELPKKTYFGNLLM